MYIITYAGGPETIIDSARIDNSSFAMKGSWPYPHEFVFIALFNTDLAGFEDEIRVADLFSVGASSHIEEGAHRIGPASFHCEGIKTNSS